MCSPLLGVASEETQMEQTTVNITNSVEPMTNSTKDLFASETADPKKVDIVKQIRRLNEDGSYTVGYEADDGTFKIESRDVLGNIKGTFGYVDPNGEIKRVSYSTSNTSQSSLMSSIAPPLVRLNRTSSSTTRRPQPTLIYPKTSSIPTKQTVIQAIPRRRPVISSGGGPAVTTTESYRVVAGNLQSTNASESITNSRQPNLKTFPIFTQRQVSVSTELNEQSNLKEFKEIEKLPVTSNSTQSTSTLPTYVRPSLVFEKNPEIMKDAKPVRGNTFRRQLSSNNYENRQMYAFQQSAGDDTTDVYGGSISLGTPRPLFTTTNRPRLIPIQISPRQKLNEKLATNSPQVHEEQQETTLEATTNKIEDENYVTTNPIPVYQFPQPQQDQRVIERPYLRPHHQQVPIAQFRTRDFLRDNPGAAVPIGNQRVLFRYNPNIPTDENGQFVRQHIQPQIQPNIVQLGPRAQHQNIENPAEVNQDNKDNLIAIPIFNGNAPNMRYPMYNTFNDGREENVIQQRPPPLPVPQQLNEIRPISTPVSTRDLKILLHHLLIKQNRLQALIDIREDLNNRGQYNPQYHQGQQQQLFNPEYQQQKALYGPRSAYPQEQRYQEPIPYRAFPQQGAYNQYQGTYSNQQNQYPNRNNDYRSQDETYRNEISNFDPSVPYESQRFVPRRQRFYNPRPYEQRFEDTPNGIESSDQVEYLPPDVREALLLKMLMLAIHPDFSQMQQESQSMMTTPVPEYRKKVRNVQILGEETQTKEATKREKRMM